MNYDTFMVRFSFADQSVHNVLVVISEPQLVALASLAAKAHHAIYQGVAMCPNDKLIRTVEVFPVHAESSQPTEVIGK